MHAQRTILFRAGAVILGLCLAGLTVEAAIRFFHLSSDARFIAAHPHYGVSNIPGAEGWYVKGEVRQYVVINGRGLRDRDRWSDGGGVLLLGDSFIAAFQVPLESTCQEVGERLLSQAAGRPVEVTAAACNGWGTVNQMAFLRHEGFSYEPKAVVVALFPENDLLDNMGIPPAACPWPPAPARKPPLLLPGFLRQAAGSSALLKACTDRVPALSNLVRPGSIRAERALVRGLFHLWHATPTEIQNRMWKRLAEVVGAMKDSVEAHDAAFGALIVPGRLALYPDEVTRLIRRQPMLRTADLDFALPRIRLAALLDSLQVPSLDLGPAFREASHTGADPLFPQEGHWTAEGNRLAAEGLRTLVIGHHMLDASSPERAPAAPGLTPGR